jgi:hypothetical protein
MSRQATAADQRSGTWVNGAGAWAPAGIDPADHLIGAPTRRLKVLEDLLLDRRFGSRRRRPRLFGLALVLVHHFVSFPTVIVLVLDDRIRTSY